MKLGKNASFGKVVCVSSREFRERRRRTLTVFVLLAVLIGTPVLSVTFFSTDTSGTVVVEPGSYYAIHVGFYGIGKLTYSFAGISGPQIYLRELDGRSFERFADGKSYTNRSWQIIDSDSERTAVVGVFWDEYLVLVNHQTSPAEIAFDVDATSYVNLTASGLMSAIAAFVAYVVWRRNPVSEETTSRSPPTSNQLKMRRKALAVAAILLITPFPIMEIIGLVVPAGSHLPLESAFPRLFIGGLLATALAFIVKFRVRVVQGEPRFVLSDLAHTIRISGYLVVEKRSMITIPISGFTVTKVTAKKIPEGTLLEYQNDTTPTGWAVIFLLLVFMFTIPFALVIALYGLYRSAAFASDIVLPRLSVPAAAKKQIDTRAVLIDSLSEGRRLSSEAYAAARSNYQDAVLICVTLVLLLSLILQAFVVSFSATLALVVGLVGAVLFSAISWRLLAKHFKPRLEQLKSWRTRFEIAFSREMAMQNPPDGEPSSFELVSESLKEAPNWLRILGKSGMFREPGYWILIVFFWLSAFQFGLAGIVILIDGRYSIGFMILLLSVVLSLSSWALYGWWRKIRDEEYRSTLKDMTARYDALRAEMEIFLRDV